MLRAALFDVGDTLAHWGVHRRQRFEWLCAQAGLELPPDPAARLAGARAAERYFAASLARTDAWTKPWWAELLAAGLVEVGLPPDLALQVAEFRVTQPDNWLLDPDAVRVLNGLRRRGYKIGVVSNWDGSLAALCDGWGISGYIDYIGDSAVFGQPKPSAAFFHHVLQQLGVAPEYAFHVGDMFDSDVIGARAAGVIPVLFDALTTEARPCEYRITGLDELLIVVDRMPWERDQPEPER